MQLAVLLPLAGQIRGLSWSPDGSFLAVGASPGIQLWNTRTGQHVATWKDIAVLDPHDRAGWTLVLIWSPDACMLAVSRAGHLVQLWDVRTGREAITLDGHTDEVGSTA